MKHFLFRVFAKYPDHVTQFFQECMPKGYTQRRVTRFARMTNDGIEDEGVMKTFHVIQLRDGVVGTIKDAKVACVFL